MTGKIGFYRAGFVGDNVVAIPAIIALRELYGDRVIIYTNTTGAQIFSPLGLACVDCECMEQDELLAHINAQKFASFILTQPNRWRCTLIEQSNIDRIFTFATFANCYKWRFKKVWFSRSFSQIPYYKALLKLVSKLNPMLYHKEQKRINQALCEFCYPIDSAAKARVESTLNAALESSEQIARITHAQTLTSAQSTHTNINHISSRPIVCLNPFLRSSAINISLESYITLATMLAKRYENMLFVLLSFSGAPRICVEHLPKNVLVFENDSNLSHLIEILRLSHLLISPSTGTIHIANMLRVSIIGIYNATDVRLWLGDSMKKERLLLLETPLTQMSKEQEKQAVTSLYSLCERALDGEL